MAYYHGSIKLNKWEQFELNTDKKKANKPIVPPKQDYGAGIAAQFGLVKKPVAPRPATTRPAAVPRDGNQTKRRKSLSEDDGTNADKTRTIEKRKEKKATDRPSESRHNVKEKSNVAKKAVPREINLGGFLGGGGSSLEADERRNKEGKKLKKKSVHAEQRGSISSPNDESADSGDESRMEKRQKAAALEKRRERERLHMERQRRVDEERARLKAAKRRNSEAQQEEAEKQEEMERRRRKKEKEREKEKLRLKEKEREKKKQRAINYDSDEDEDEEEVDEEDEDEDEDPSSDERRKHKTKGKSRGSFSVEAWSRPLRGNYEESEDEEDEEEEEEDDNEEEEEAEEEEETDRRKKQKGRQLQEDVRDRKRKRDDKRGRDEQHNSDSSDNEQNLKEGRRKSLDDDAFLAEKRKKKQREQLAAEKEAQREKNQTPNTNKESQALAKKKTFTIPKVVSGKDTSKEKMKIDKNSQVKDEPESPTTTCISVSNQISQKSTSLRNNGRLKSSQSCSHVINVDGVSNLSSTPSKTASLPKSSIIKEKEKRISSAAIEIKSEPDDDEYTSPNTSKDAPHRQQSNKSGDTNKLNNTFTSRSPFTSPDEKSASSLIEKFAAEQAPKAEPPVKVNLDTDTCVTRDSSKTLRCAKGNNLKDWLRSVVSRLGKKSTRMDSSSLNYFITLHSRFKVLTETNEMGDLEVLPEKDGNNDGKEPIRIFTNLWKENYQQYLDESLLNSIPEIIITRLYVSGSGGGSGGAGSSK